MLSGGADAQDAPAARPAGFLRRRRRQIFAAVIILLFAGIAFRIHQFSHPAAMRGRGARYGAMHAPNAGAAVAVAVAAARRGDISRRIPALGAITPLATVIVKTQISGLLQKIAFTEGQMVHAGQFLAQIDPRPYEAALNQAKAALDRDSALLANARLDLARYRGLIADNAIAQQQLDTQQSLVKQYEGTVEGDRAQARSAALNLEYTHIVSPIAGRVGLRQVDQGNYVTPGDANGIVVVTQLQPISAIFSIPEENADAILTRLQRGETLDVQAYDPLGRRKIADGKLLTIDNQIDVATGTFKLRALFDNKDGSLFPNQFVTIRLLETVLHDQLLIPSAAVHRGAPNGVASTFVYRVNANHTVSVTPVVLGAADGDIVAVKSGLAAGDIVVTEGGDRLRNGAAVELPAAAPAPARARSGRRRQARGGGRRR